MCRIAHINTYHFNELLSSVPAVFPSSVKKLPNKSPNTSHVKHFFDFLGYSKGFPNLPPIAVALANA